MKEKPARVIPSHIKRKSSSIEDLSQERAQPIMKAAITYRPSLKVFDHIERIAFIERKKKQSLLDEVIRWWLLEKHGIDDVE